MKIELMDTTLRDGEQTPRVSFSENEKFNIAKVLLEEVKVDRIEIASARISQGELMAAKRIGSWAKEEMLLDKIEVLGFVDGVKSVDWIKEAGLKVLNLLCKGSLKHVKYQLKKEPIEHMEDIKKVVMYAIEKDITVNVYLEDWSNGMNDSMEYVFELMDFLKTLPINRYMLPDTLGTLQPMEVYNFVKKMTDKYEDLHFDFHAHNDYDFAVANTLMSVLAGAKGVHTTVNGLGERTGNAPLSSVISAIEDHVSNVEWNVDESKLNKISKLVEVFSSVRIPANKPIIGDNVFTQTCGVHADGDTKANLYYNKLLPERFGRRREYALGKTSGKASIERNLEELGIELDKESILKVTKRIVELGDKKENITTEDLPYIVSDVLGSTLVEEKIQLENYYICHAKNLRPVATIKLKIDNKSYEETAYGDGQYDAFMKAVTKIYNSLERYLPNLIDYAVAIPPGGQTNALVETVITWKNGKEFKTRGLESDQTAAAIQATLKMLNIMENEFVK